MKKNCIACIEYWHCKRPQKGITVHDCGFFNDGGIISPVNDKKQENAMKDNIIDFEENIPHEVSEVICIHCKKRWIAVRPTVTLLKDIDCPGCNQTGYVIETGQKINEETKPCMI